MRTDIIIINSVEQAKYCVDQGHHHNRKVYSTHSSVDTYLTKNCNIHSQCISAFISVEELQLLRDKSSVLVDDLIDKLESRISPILNEQNNLKMQYFRWLYSYWGKILCHVYLSFIDSFGKLLKEEDVGKIYYYNFKFKRLLDADTDLSVLLTTFFSQHSIEELSYEPRLTKRIVGKLQKCLGVLIRIKNNISSISRILKLQLFGIKVRRFSKERKTVFISEPLYDLKFLIDELSEYNLLYYSNKMFVPFGMQNKVRQQSVAIDRDCFNSIEVEAGTVLGVLMNDIKKDFISKYPSFMKDVFLLRDIHKVYPTTCAIWGNSPCSRVRSFLYNYLHTQNVKIIGAQHGGNFAERYQPWHYDSDYRYCDDFISYGFTKEDLDRSMRGQEIQLNVKSYGRVSKDATNTYSGRSVDIMYPLNNTASIFIGGMKRLPPDQLTERQIKILDYLEGLESKAVYAKPFKNSDDKNCSVMPILKNLKNVKVVDSVDVEKFICDYSPKIIILDTPSTPLYRVLQLDAEIFLMDNPFVPFESVALNMLEKRVHYSQDVEEFIELIDGYLNGEIKSKRDDEFYQHYAYRPNSKENILKHIKDSVESSGKSCVAENMLV